MTLHIGTLTQAQKLESDANRLYEQGNRAIESGNNNAGQEYYRKADKLWNDAKWERECIPA